MAFVSKMSNLSQTFHFFRRCSHCQCLCSKCIHNSLTSPFLTWLTRKHAFNHQRQILARQILQSVPIHLPSHLIHVHSFHHGNPFPRKMSSNLHSFVGFSTSQSTPFFCTSTHSQSQMQLSLRYCFHKVRCGGPDQME